MIASTEALVSPDAPAAIVAAAGRIDVLVANLAIAAPSTRAHGGNIYLEDSTLGGLRARLRLPL